MGADARRKTREKVRSYRERKKAGGFRLLQKWIPDTRSSAFAEEARRQSELIANSPYEADDQAFIDSISELKFG